MSYDYGRKNWAEEEILRLASLYGNGDYIQYVVLDENGNTLPQTKVYGLDKISYPDIENEIDGILYMLIEVKSRGQFYKDNKFLALKEFAYRNYKRVQNEEKSDVRVVYLIGNKEEYELFWMDFAMFDEMKKHKEYFQDINDKRASVYYFFHSSQLKTNAKNLFDIFE